ncbi:tRNA1(Val) (adenine(37)-N6)-methyltransferase [Pseudoruegeria sp. SK021]|uniref:tRNA1(Val) (adenine(37)-N6)-methyltransferase n=1 Tax=Pseudoruegeria sp. SK021 TaxID=1933035 RepID=UPI000A242EB7|nr:methyltransferase [Pseudoruegeria sp. SK021]OSP55657.1 methyltransferase [Pseudoruegeria sp. SK021]
MIGGTVSISHDSFLGGRLTVAQPANGYRAGIDAVLLAASVPATAGDRVLELGCGVGVASLCLMTRVAGLHVMGLEIQPDYAELARLNAKTTGQPLAVFTGDLSNPPAEVRAQSFEHVIANPPYFKRDAGTRAHDSGRERALGEDTPMSAWIDTAIRRLIPGGTLSLVQRTERLPEILAAFGTRLGAVQVLPLSPRSGQPATLFLLRARKGRRTALQLLSPLILHLGARHGSDQESYTPAVAAALRNGAGLDGFDR